MSTSTTGLPALFKGPLTVTLVFWCGLAFDAVAVLVSVVKAASTMIGATMGAAWAGSAAGALTASRKPRATNGPPGECSWGAGRSRAAGVANGDSGGAKSDRDAG